MTEALLVVFMIIVVVAVVFAFGDKRRVRRPHTASDESALANIASEPVGHEAVWSTPSSADHFMPSCHEGHTSTHTIDQHCDTGHAHSHSCDVGSGGDFGGHGHH